MKNKKEKTAKQIEREKIKKEVEIISDDMYGVFIMLFAKDAKQIFEFDWMWSKYRLNKKIKKDDQILRSAIAKARNRLAEKNLLLINIRDKGYKISDKFEALDDKEKGAIRLLRAMLSFQKQIFNATLSDQDLLNDPDRKIQYEILKQIVAFCHEHAKEIELTLERSPFHGKNKREVKGSNIYEDTKDHKDEADGDNLADCIL